MATKEPIGERITRVETKLDEISQKLDDFIKCADEKYAPKWVADMAKWMLVTTGGAVFAFIGWLIIEFLEHK